MKFHIICLAVTICAFDALAQGPTRPPGGGSGGPGGRRGGSGGPGGSGGRGGGRRRFSDARVGPPRENVSVWNRTVGAGEVTQIGFSNATQNKVDLLNFDRRGRDLNLNRGTTLYDFSGLEPTTAVKVGFSCFLIPNTVGLTYSTAAAEVLSRNQTTVLVPPANVYLNATDDPLTDAEKAVLPTQVQQFCYNLPTYEAVSVDSAIFPDEASLPEGQQRIVRMVTLNDLVNILANAAPEPHSGGPGNRGGRGGPRDGHKRRNNTTPTTTTLAPASS